MITEYLAVSSSGFIIGLIVAKFWPKTNLKVEVQNYFDVDGIACQVESGQLKISKPRPSIIFEVESKELSIGVTNICGGFTQDKKETGCNTYFQIKDEAIYCINLNKEQIKKLTDSVDKFKAMELQRAMENISSMALESAVKRLDKK